MGTDVTHLVVAPLLIPLLTAIATLLTRRRPRLQRAISLLGNLAYLITVAALADAVFAGGILTYQVSNWAAPFGISLVADALSVFMLGIAAVVTLASLTFSVGYLGEFRQRVSYHPLFHFMLVGITGAFLTGDVFNLFVWFEVMLMPSYVLVVFYSGAEHTRAALQYTVLNLVGSAVMLVAIGGLYATTGTLNMADMARRLANPEVYNVSLLPVLGLAAVLFAVFSLKAGIVPFQFWVPAAYKAAPAPVTAVLAGVTKKVGVYAIIRLLFTVFAAAELPGGLGLPGFSGTSFLGYFGPVLFVMATASIFLGGIAAVNREDVDTLLAYSSIGQVGFIILPLALAATTAGAIQVPVQIQVQVQVLGIAAALVYALNHALAKGLLFLVSGAIYERVGSIRLADLGGLSERTPLIAGSYFVGALALVGIPPLSGFFGKLLVFETAGRGVVAGVAGAWPVLGVALAGAILTIAYLSVLWNRAFWGPAVSVIGGSSRQRWFLVSVLLALAATIVVVGIAFDPVYEAARSAARAALDRDDAYVRAVLSEVSR